MKFYCTCYDKEQLLTVIKLYFEHKTYAALLGKNNSYNETEFNTIYHSSFWDNCYVFKSFKWSKILQYKVDL
jgi:hypothetical protein